MAERPVPSDDPLVTDAGGGARRTRFEDKKQRILDVATVLLNERGVTGMTFQEVAQALSLKTTSVIYYFRYKELLAAAVLEDSIERLHAMVREAGTEPTPEARVEKYLALFFDRTARSLRKEMRPLANFSEIRALDEEYRLPLIAQYQALFRDVREFFGTSDDPDRKRVLTARTQLLNESLFWATFWLPHYALGDFDSVRRRMFDILREGIGAKGLESRACPLTLEEALDAAPLQSPFMRIATRLINEHGYKGASVDSIMREMNLTKGSFYHHNEAKDDLILECFRESYRRLTRLQIAVDARGGTRWQRLENGIASVLVLQFASDHPLLRSTALQAMPAALRAEALELSNREALWLAGALLDGMREGSVRLIDPAIAGHIIMSTINSAYDVRGWAAGQPLELAVSRFAGLLTKGIFD
ncbi:TetR/AcrR family transcriptional regulator [Sphingobium chlorophenolicum]|uniref:Regulatory protein TetR n=1 Tax=Sphingobium chlorophenolicum TaxID=46429 RepID=A0A081RC13_SPHCR|nr:TetR/AcrR family transcriptional regulator [Sphingobium chlorophenolicum]KEQ52736.1 Regulatory protein TetR [Sphingobium chlorophenolicum]